MSWHVVVTGSSGGIGRAVCERLLQAGHMVTGFDRRPPKDAAWQHSEVDFAVAGAAHDAGKRAARRAPVTHLVHCAAVQLLGSVGQVGAAAWQETLQVNLLSVDELARATMDDLSAASGAIVVISSVHAQASTPGMAAYATSKAALNGWVRAAALDLAPAVRVNALEPGAVRTKMLDEGLTRRPADGEAPQALDKLRAKTPLERIAEPREIAEVVVAMLAPSFSFVTGAVLPVDGGALLCLGTE